MCRGRRLAPRWTHVRSGWRSYLGWKGLPPPGILSLRCRSRCAVCAVIAASRPDCTAKGRRRGTTPLGLETPRTPPNRPFDRVSCPNLRDIYFFFFFLRKNYFHDKFYDLYILYPLWSLKSIFCPSKSRNSWKAGVICLFPNNCSSVTWPARWWSTPNLNLDTNACSSYLAIRVPAPEQTTGISVLTFSDSLMAC